MLRSLLSRLTRWRAGRHPDDEDNTSSGFRPSEIVASVLYAHGMDVERLEEEIADIEEQAARIEEARRDH